MPRGRKAWAAFFTEKGQRNKKRAPTGAVRASVASIVSQMRTPAITQNVEAVAQDRRPYYLGRNELKSIVASAEGLELYHNTPNSLNPGWPSQGTSVSTRVGDVIKIRRIKVKLWLSAKPDRPNINIRVTYVTTTNPSFATADLYTGINVMVGAINNPEVRVHHDTVVKIPTTTYQYSATASKEDSIVYWFDLPIGGNLAFRRGTTTPNVSHILFLSAYDYKAAFTTDNIASAAWSIEVAYEDA